MRDIIIFGTGQIAELAHYYFTTDTERTVAGFTVDDAHKRDDSLIDLPVCPFEEISEVYPPTQFDIFVALSYSKLNALRKEKFEAARSLGYTCASYVSSRATILNDGSVGENCFILEDNTVQPFVTIGDNVTLWSGNHIDHHSAIGSHCFIASHVVVSGNVAIGESCFLGVNATLRDGITIGARCVIGAGAMVMGNAERGGLYVSSATERSRVPSSRIRDL